MMEVRNASVHRNGRAILDGVSCRVRPGRVTVVMGKNGAGKSTLLRVLAGDSDYGADAGAVKVGGRALSDYTPAELAARRAVLPQAVHLGFALSVREVVELGCYHRYARLTARERVTLVDHYLDLLNLIPLAHRSFPTLSGGEQKRVLLAKCFLQLDTETASSGPDRFLLLDEPTAALDLEQQYRFLDLTGRLAREAGVGVLAILHDLNQASSFADELLFLRDGRVTATGRRDAVLTAANIRTTFDVGCVIQPHPHYDGPLITTMPYARPNIAPALAPQ